MTADPKRLMDEESSPLVDMLRVAKGDVLSTEGVERVQAGLVAAGIVVGTVSATAVAAKPLAAAGMKLFGISIVKIGIAALTLAVLGGGVVVAMSVNDVRAPAPVATPTELSRPVQAPIAPAASTQATAVTADPVEPSAPSAPAPPPTSSAPRVAPPPSVKAAPSAPAAPSASAVPSATIAAPPTIREGSLLLEARRALDTDPARSLALVQQHQKEFPTSQLAPERSRIEQEARKRIGGR